MIPVIDFLSPAKPKSLSDIPQRPLAAMAVKLYLLGALAWDYTDTVVDIAVQMRCDRTKPLCRAIRELRRRYDRFRQSSLDSSDIAREKELGELFEKLQRKHIDKLCYGLRNEISQYGLDADSVYLVQAVQMAMTVIGGMKLYAAECDEWIRKQGVADRHSMLSDYFIALETLLPEFAGDCYDRHSESRRITAAIICNGIRHIDIYDDDGKIYSPGQS